MHKELDMCLQKIKALIMKFVQDKKLSGGVTPGNICREMWTVRLAFMKGSLILDLKLY